MKDLKYIFTIILTVSITSCEKEDISSSMANSNIIFISRRNENSAEWSLCIMEKDGSNQQKLSDLTVRYSKPVISHSGKTVLFVHYTEDFFYELYSINTDGTNLTLIDRANRYCGSADWSFDDLKIIYSKSRNESIDNKDLILFDILTNSKKTLTETGNNISARFSPDNRIAYCQQQNPSNGIFVMDIDGANKQLIIPNAGDPVWSPDGKRIAYNASGDFGSPQIFVAKDDGSDPKQLTKTYLLNWDSGYPTFGNYSPRWTPDGKKIVYQSSINDGLPEIYIMDSNGSNQKRLTNTERRNENPELSSDGKFIVFSSNRDLTYNADIYVMDIDGENQYALSKYSGDDCLPVLINK
jgi:TolB protein